MRANRFTHGLGENLSAPAIITLHATAKVDAAFRTLHKLARLQGWLHHAFTPLTREFHIRVMVIPKPPHKRMPL